MTTFRALGGSVPLVPRLLPGSFSLGANPPSIIDKNDGQVPRVAGEPSLNAALGLLSADEVADYRAWGQSEKLQFLTGYQYIAVMSAAGLKRPDGTPFDGLLTQGISVAFQALDAAKAYFGQMSADVAQAASQMASVLKDASTKTEPRSLDFSKKYSLLRDRIAWELATQNDLTIEYEIVGTDPANPGIIWTRKIGEDRAPDYSAVFSTRTPKQLFDDGLALQDKFDNLGVTFKKLDMSGANLRLGAGPALILTVLITLIVGILSFYWLWNHVDQQNKLTQLAVNFITSDASLSSADKASKIAQLQAANNFFSQMFGSSVPWTEILIVVGLGVLAFLAYPYIITESRHRGYLGGTE